MAQLFATFRAWTLIDAKRNADLERRQRGQSVTEFALIFPLLMITFLAIIDLSRIYTTQLSVESAAREAADYGAYNSSNWIGNPSDPRPTPPRPLRG